MQGDLPLSPVQERYAVLLSEWRWWLADNWGMTDDQILGLCYVRALHAGRDLRNRVYRLPSRGQAVVTVGRDRADNR